MTTMTDTFDARQRAMLAEMGVRVWAPEAPVVPVASVPSAPVAEAVGAGASTVGGPEVQVQDIAVAQALSLAAALPAAVVPRASEDVLSYPSSAHTELASAPAMSARAPVAPRQTAGVTGTTATVTTAAHAAPAETATLGQRPEGIDRMNWPALQTAVAGCEACGLCKTRKNTVFGVGAPAQGQDAPQVDWLIVGEAPGENEDLQGEPFVGQAGKLLDNMLKACGLSRHGERGLQGGGVYIANVLKCRPPGNRNPRPEEVAQCEPFLQRQVELLRPKIILAMGRFAVQSLLAGTVPNVEAAPLGKLRGKVYDYRGVPVVVTYHPAYLLRSLPEKAKAWADLCLAMAQMRGRG